MTPLRDIPVESPEVVLTEDGMMTNSGVWAVHGSAWSHRFLRHIAGSPQLSKNASRTNSLRWDVQPFLRHPQWEQAALQTALYQSVAEADRDRAPGSRTRKFPVLWEPWLQYGCGDRVAVESSHFRSVGEVVLQAALSDTDEDVTGLRLRDGDARVGACTLASWLQSKRAAAQGETHWTQADLVRLARKWRYVPQQWMNGYPPEIARNLRDRADRNTHRAHRWQAGSNFSLSFSGCALARGRQWCEAQMESAFDRVHAWEWAQEK